MMLKKNLGIKALLSVLIVIIIAVATNAILTINTEKNISLSEGEDTSVPERNIKLGFTIAIDPGHSAIQDLRMERIGPDTSEEKYRGTTGAEGVVTKVPEYKLTLSIAKKLEKELKNRGYEVYMVRRSNNVRISNIERANKINASKADICVRIHADSVDDASVHGISTHYKTGTNRIVTGKTNLKSKKLSKKLLNFTCKATGAYKRGSYGRRDLTLNNWCKLPTALIEVGFMSNRAEDRLMQKTAYQKKLVKGICDAVDSYYKYDRR